jgi:tetratricopeptide (TPR) repeat protein
VPSPTSSDADEAIKLNASDLVAYYDRGLCWKSKKEYDKAIVDFSEAIRLDPKHAGAYNDRAWMWANCPD